MAGSGTAKLEELTAQVEQLSAMLEEVESNLKGIQEARGQNRWPRRRFARWGPVRNSQSQGEEEGNGEDTTTHSGNYQEYPLDQQAPTSQQVPPEMMSTLGSLFGKSPAKMSSLLQTAQQILGGMKPMASGWQQGQEANGSSGGVVSPGEAGDVGISAAVQRVSHSLPSKLQSVSHQLAEAASEDPFIGTAVHIDAKLREISDTVEGFIGILLLLRDMAGKYRH